MEMVVVLQYPLLLHLVLWLVTRGPVAAAASSSVVVPSQVVLPGCPDKCGDVSIPYPFGTRKGCYYRSDENEAYWIRCNEAFSPPRPFIGSSDIEVLKVSLEALLVQNWIARKCYNESGGVVSRTRAFMSFDRLTPYRFSDTRNRFTVLGCETFALIVGSSNQRSRNGLPTNISFATGCVSVCASQESDSVATSGCTANGCCQTEIPKGLKWLNVSLGNVNVSSVDIDPTFKRCDYAFLADNDELSTHLSDPNFVNNTRDVMPVVLDWAVGNETCEEAREMKSTPYACRAEYSNCTDSTNGSGYRCNCLPGYQGNPYLPQGCQGVAIRGGWQAIVAFPHCGQFCLLAIIDHVLIYLTKSNIHD